MKSAGKFSMVVMMMMSIYSVCLAEEEMLRFLVWDGYAPEHFQKAFIQRVKEKHGIDLKMDVKGSTGSGDFFDALRKGTADVLSPGHTAPKDERYQMIKRSLILPLNMENIPNYKNVIKPLQNLDYWTEDGKIYAAPTDTGPYGLAYNSAVMKDPKTWNRLWNPDMKKKYVIGKEEYFCNVYITALAMGFRRDEIHDYRKLNTPEFREKLAYLAENAHHMWLGVYRPEDLEGMSLAALWGVALTEKNLNAQWLWSDPKEGTPSWIDLLVLSHTLEKKPKLKQIAEEWINFTLSDEYQKYMAMIQGGTPVTSRGKNILPEETVKWYRLDDLSYFMEKQILWPSLKNIDQKGILQLWNDAVKKAENKQNG